MAGRRISIEFLGNSRDLVNAIESAENHTGRLSSTLKSVGKVAALGLAAGAVVAGKALFDMTKGAIEDQAAQKKLATNLKNATGATDDQVASVEDWITAQGKALGVTDDELRPALSKLATATGDVGKAQDLASLAMDASAATGKSLESTAKALADAEQGRLGGLGKLGIATKNAAGETLSLDEIHKNMAKTFEGAAASSAETVAGKMARLKLTLSEAGETIGAKLIPVVADLAGWFLDKALPAISRFGNWVQDNLIPIFGMIGDKIRSVTGGMNGDVSTNLTAIKDTISSFVSIVQSLWHIFGDDILEYARKSFENIKQVIGGALQVISGIFKIFSSLLKGDWSGVWDGIKQVAGGALDVLKGMVKQALNVITGAWSLAWTGLKGAFSSIWSDISEAIGRKIDETVTKIRNKISDFKTAGKDLIGSFVEGMKGAGGLVSDIAGNIWTSVKGLLNDAIDKINAALEFTIDPPGPGPTVHINPANIPHLANGTRNFRGGLALVGEQGPEIVTLPRGAAVTPNRESMGAMRGLSGGSPLYVVNVNTLDQTGVAEAVERAFIKLARDTGQPLQFPTVSA